MAAGDEPIAADEILFRRIPVVTGWYDANKRSLSPQAFRPNENDSDGLSLSRAKYCTPRQAAARGRRGRNYWIAPVRAQTISDMGLAVRPDPEPDGSDPSHACVPAMHYAVRREPVIQEHMLMLATLCATVEGPFPGEFIPPKVR